MRKICRKWFLRVREERGDFGMNAVIGIAIGLIVAAFVLLPGIRGFADTIVKDLQNWWDTGIASNLFPSN
ncbi:hypothetical protein [Fusibacter tunisiensis]|uniref:Uncharacterized protein n=1 Tax=Fusibacter tunisiensis TaxID=1008308 RepID=A0ABS2MNJ8_9FIRM|nr:hypothetical protein [Fusibacter tunisiensis]MBM7560978.1 hypothetical protein [Fusibacter tunisiensis]